MSTDHVQLEEHSDNGQPPVDQGYLTVQETLANAPADCLEEDVNDVFGGRVRIRALTAGQQARVKQGSVNMHGRNPTLDFAALERAQFRYGVIIPTLTEGQVRELQEKSGPSWARVIAAIDKLSGTDKEELRKAQLDFPGQQD